MPFDARAAKLLQPGQHFTITEHPGLRLTVSAAARSWTYRYKSPTDGRMRQVKIGEWPKMSFNAAVVEWEKLRDQRAAGVDVADVRRTERAAAAAEKVAQRAAASGTRYTVAKLCDEYWQETVVPNRKPAGVKEVRRLFDKMLGDVANLEPHQVTRSVAFDLIQGHADTPVVASHLRSELGSAWEHALDAGRLDGNVPNWWRLIMRGKLRSKGRYLQGERVGTKKRVLSEAELGQLIRFLPNMSRMIEEVLTLYLWTALRGSEITAIRGDQLTQEPDGLWLTIPLELTKNVNRERAVDHRVPLVGRAETIVRRRWSLYGAGYLFPSGAGSKVPHVQQKAIGVGVWTRMPYSGTRPQQERVRLPVTHWAPHDLRRSSRTLLAKLGCPDEVGEAILGHLPFGIIGTYNLHRYDAEKLEWLTRLSERLEELAAQGG